MNAHATVVFAITGLFVAAPALALILQPLKAWNVKLLDFRCHPSQSLDCRHLAARLRTRSNIR